MNTRTPKWNAALTRPIPMEDGQLLRTLADARALTLKNKTARERDPWRRAEPLLNEAAATGSDDDIARVTGQIEMVLFGEGKLDLTNDGE
jgi:hypothetical protein